jgi:D-alanyl-D-alanine endopeptidase (penicillin-binding protein 7)
MTGCGTLAWRAAVGGNRLSFRVVLRRSCSLLPTLGRGLEYAQTTKCMDWKSAPREVASKCFADYRLSATMPMTLTVSTPQRLPTVRTRTTNWIAVFAAALMCMGGWVADADAAPRSRTRASSARKGTAVKARPKVSKARKRATSTRISSVRRSRLARARARHTQWLEAQQPRYKTDASGALVPDVRAAAAIIYNPETGQVLWEANSLDKRSIASITKVMTAAVVLEDDPDLSEVVVIDRGDTYAANHTYLRPKDRVSIGDLLHLTLIASDNAAARALARSSPEGSAAFIDRMNAKAQEMGLDSTTYRDPSGLDASNMSSAFDMARLIAFAAADERIASIMRTPYYTVRTQRRVISIHSTNQLVMKGDVDVRGGKTGFISKAGYCLATLLRLPQTNQQVAVVVLGASSNAGRFMETRHLFNWLSSKTKDLLAPSDPPAAAIAAAATQP